MSGRREEGAVLLTVLLIVAVMAAVSALMLDRLKLATMLAGNAAAASQARLDLMGVESAALARIGQLRASGLRNRRADWQGRPLTLPLPGALATATLADGGNCFNLNSLVAEQDGARVADPEGRRQFVRLAALTGVPQADAERIADAATDWLDTDGSPTGAGGEDATYAALKPSYYAANRLMADVTEARALAGMTPAIWAQLRPWLCALPMAGPAPLNVNALTPEQAPLLATLTLNGDTGQARAIIAARPADGWTTVADSPQLLALADDSAWTDGPGVEPRFYRAELAVERAGVRLTSTLLIDARQDPARVVQRRWGEE